MGALDGIRVIEMEGVGPGPFAAMWLADMGADVIRISRPGQRANQTRRDVLNRGRRSVAVDLKRPGAAEVVLRLTEKADVLLEGYRPGVMERLGLGPQVCHARAPGLVYARITGWGQEGPLAPRAGHDINYLALTGLLGAIGPGDDRPVPPLNLLADFGGGGMLLVSGILAALVERYRSGRGQVLDAALIDGASLLAGMIWAYRAKGQWQDRREANLFDGGAPFYGTYRCRDGRYVALGCIEHEFWQIVLERAGWTQDPLLAQRDDRSAWPAVRARLAELIAARTQAEWVALFENTDACLSPVLTLGEALEHPHNVERSAFISLADTPQPAPAPRLQRTPACVGGVPPLVGEDTVEVLREAGLSAAEIEDALANGTVQQLVGEA